MARLRFLVLVPSPSPPPNLQVGSALVLALLEIRRMAPHHKLREQEKRMAAHFKGVATPNRMTFNDFLDIFKVPTP